MLSPEAAEVVERAIRHARKAGNSNVTVLSFLHGLLDDRDIRELLSSVLDLKVLRARMTAGSKFAAKQEEFAGDVVLSDGVQEILAKAESLNRGEGETVNPLKLAESLLTIESVGMRMFLQQLRIDREAILKRLGRSVPEDVSEGPLPFEDQELGGERIESLSLRFLCTRLEVALENQQRVSRELEQIQKAIKALCRTD